MNNSYEYSYVEVLEILKHIPKKEYEKIPKEKIDFYRTHMNKTYQYEYNPSAPKTSRITDAIIINLYKNYIASNHEKKIIEEILMLNYQKEEIKKRQKYNPDNLFKK